MKILILADDFPPRAIGGGGRVAEQVALGYAVRGHEVHVLTTVRSSDDEGDYMHGSIRVRAIHSDYDGRWAAYRGLYNPSTVSKVKAAIATLKPEVVHAHNIHQHLSYHSLKLAKQSGARVLLTAHDCMLFHYGKFDEYVDPHDLSIPTHFDYRIHWWQQLAVYKKRYNPFRNIIIRHYLKYCDAICPVSHALQEALAENGIKDTVVVYNGMNVAEWQTRLEHAPDMPALKKLAQHPAIGFVGKMSGAKGGQQVLRAFKEILAKMPEALLCVIGPEESFTPNAQALVKELGVASAVVVTGKLAGAELAAAYAACTVLAYPSVCLDTFGMANIEAMATGKPVVATCFGGSPEVVEAGVTGTIVNPLDVPAFSAALLDFLTNPEKAAQYGRAGRARVESEFTLDRQVDAYLALMR